MKLRIALTLTVLCAWKFRFKLKIGIRLSVGMTDIWQKVSVGMKTFIKKHNLYLNYGGKSFEGINTGAEENLVFIELKRRNSEVYYHKEKYECDFIIAENKEILDAIQVTVSLKDTKEREYRGLLEALNKYKLDTGLILTENEEYEEIVEGKKIVVKAIWKWLLE